MSTFLHLLHVGLYFLYYYNIHTPYLPDIPMYTPFYTHIHNIYYFTYTNAVVMDVKKCAFNFIVLICKSTGRLM